MKEEMMNDTIDDAVCRPAYLALNLIRIDWRGRWRRRIGTNYSTSSRWNWH
jgi:hypothetical protein